uniref:Uncharacterized protein n=1 Tax=Octopus bimaculoides TaxID=37653 RepID=A0A0L8H2W0_OCTBM
MIIIIIHKDENEAKMIDVAISGDSRLECKETEKIEKYQPLQDEIGKLWGMRTVIVTLVVIGALGAVSKGSEKHMKNIGADARLEVIQKTALLGTAHILRRLLSL